MRIRVKIHETECDAQGKVKGGGAVSPDLGLTRSVAGGGCGLRDCNCSPGHWITIGLPIDRGVKQAVQFIFESQADRDRFAEVIGMNLDMMRPGSAVALAPLSVEPIE
jgi:hypothetical protein